MTNALSLDTRELLNKVPEVTLYFWTIKILSTTVGETAADFLNFNWHFGLTATTMVMSALLAISLFRQLRAKAYVPWLYWMTVLLISVVGTLITDNLTDNFGIPLATTTLAFSLALVATFVAWYLKERTLSIHTIYSGTRELFYWAAILFTFALGTAAGDWVAETMNMGYTTAALMFGGMIAAITLAHYGFKMNAVLAFWLAYILTRPLGASCGDLLTQPLANGGLGWDNMQVNAVFLATITSLVLYLTITRRDVAASRSAS